MVSFYKKIIIWFFTFIGGFYFFLEFVLPKKIGEFEFGTYNDQISTGIVVMGAMAVGLGLVNILRVHGHAVVFFKKNWISSLALLLGLMLMVISEGVQFVDATLSRKAWTEVVSWGKYSKLVYAEKESKPPIERIKALLNSLEKTKDNMFFKIDNQIISEIEKNDFNNSYNSLKTKTNEVLECYRATLKRDCLSEHQELETSIKQFALVARAISEKNSVNSYSKICAQFLYNGLFVPLGAAMFSLLAFYIANAAYRSFRIRSVEAVCMMFAALVVILGQIPHGTIYISDSLPAIRLWLLKNISTPSFRAISFGASIAGLAMAVRMWLSLEESPFSKTKEEESRGS